MFWLTIGRLQALDLLLDKMKRAGLNFSRVKALSGSGQVRWQQVLLCFLLTFSFYFLIESEQNELTDELKAQI